jgi:hypothetical protein
MASECPFIVGARLQSKDGICWFLGQISHGTYDTWQSKGIVPGPVPGTNRYDVPSHHAALDRRCGLAASPRQQQLSPLEAWEASHAA